MLDEEFRSWLRAGRPHQICTVCCPRLHAVSPSVIFLGQGSCDLPFIAAPLNSFPFSFFLQYISPAYRHISMSFLSPISPHLVCLWHSVLVGVFAHLQSQSHHWCVGEDFVSTDPLTLRNLTPFYSMWLGLIKYTAWIALQSAE